MTSLFNYYSNNNHNCVDKICVICYNTDMKNIDKRVYISGPISAKLDTYKQDFAGFENALRRFGYHNIMNPSVLPSTGFEYEDYMKIAVAMMHACDIVVFMDGWVDSPGCQTEHYIALERNMHCFYSLDSARAYAEIVHEAD